MSTTYDEARRRLWRGTAAAYADSFGALCAHTVPALLDAAAIGPGSSVLDAGCGTGTLTAAALERAAAVTAVDAEESMVTATAASCPGAIVIRAELPRLPFPAAGFDAAVANFVINHVGRPAEAVAELGRVTRAGGRVAVTVWPQPAPALQQLWLDVIASSDVTPAPAPRLAEGDDFDRSPAGLHTLLRGAGLVDVDITVVEWEHRVDAQTWWAGALNGIASIGHVVAAQDGHAVARMRVRYDILSASFRREDGLLHLPTAALLGVGTRTG